MKRYYQVFVDKDALPGGSNEGEPPIIVRLIEETADGPRPLGRTKHWRVDVPGPSTVVSNLEGSAPHVWVETQSVRPQPPA